MYKGIFVSYRRGKYTQKNNQILIRIEEINNRNDAARFIGMEVIWKNQKGTALLGKIVGVHGKGGTLKATFKKSPPGQAIGDELIIQ